MHFNGHKSFLMINTCNAKVSKEIDAIIMMYVIASVWIVYARI
jgi:hypothetical protein